MDCGREKWGGLMAINNSCEAGATIAGAVARLSSRTVRRLEDVVILLFTEGDILTVDQYIGSRSSIWANASLSCFLDVSRFSIST